MEAYGGYSIWKGSPCDFDLWDLLTFMSMYYVSQEPTGRWLIIGGEDICIQWVFKR